MKYMYCHSCMISTCELIGICGIYMAFQRHICYWYIAGNSVITKGCSIYFFICAVMWDLYVDCRAL